MVGYNLLDVDREKILNDPRLRRLICPFCTHLVREPIVLSCNRHVCCGSCLESNCTPKEGDSSVAVRVAVCPVDGQEFLFGEVLHRHEEAQEQVMSLAIHCAFNCGWYGIIRQMETHIKDYHQKGKKPAKGVQCQIRKAPSQHDTQLSDPALVQVAVPGPSGVSQESSLQDLPEPDGEQSWHDVAQALQHQQSMDHNDIELLKQQLAVLFGAYTTEKHHREQLQDVVRTIEGKLQVLEQKQCVDRIDVEQIKQQLAALGDAVVTERRDHEELQEKLRIVEGQVQELETGDHLEQLKQQIASLTDSLTAVTHHDEHLQGEVRAVVAKVEDLERQQHVGQKATEELKKQLAEFANSFAVEKRDHQRLQEKVTIADGRIQALEQQLDAHKNECASAQAECMTERARGIEALNMQGGVLQDYIGGLQSSVAHLQENQADLEAQVRGLEVEQSL